jgi:hypothetical protein
VFDSLQEQIKRNGLHEGSSLRRHFCLYVRVLAAFLISVDGSLAVWNETPTSQVVLVPAAARVLEAGSRSRPADGLISG